MPDVAGRSPARQIRLFLRDFRRVDARAHLAEGQSLVSFLANRRSYLTLTDVHWTGTGERAELAVVRVSQVLWASAPDSDIALIASSATPRSRDVELQLEGGLLVRAAFNMIAGQRLGDYLETAGPFIPVFGAHLLKSGRPPRDTNVVLGDVALNHEAIQAVWDASAAVRAPDVEDAAPVEAVPTGEDGATAA